MTQHDNTTKQWQSQDGRILEILAAHKHRKDGSYQKGVCTSAVLAWLGIAPHEYKGTLTKQLPGILRRAGYAVRSRKSAFKIGKTNMSTLRRTIKNYSGDTDATVYLVFIHKNKSSHVLLLDSTGETVCDTSPDSTSRSYVYLCKAIFPKKVECPNCKGAGHTETWQGETVCTWCDGTGADPFPGPAIAQVLIRDHKQNGKNIPPQ